MLTCASLTTGITHMQQRLPQGLCPAGCIFAVTTPCSSQHSAFCTIPAEVAVPCYALMCKYAVKTWCVVSFGSKPFVSKRLSASHKLHVYRLLGQLSLLQQHLVQPGRLSGTLHLGRDLAAEADRLSICFVIATVQVEAAAQLLQVSTCMTCLSTSKS